MTILRWNVNTEILLCGKSPFQRLIFGVVIFATIQRQIGPQISDHV